MLVIHLFDTQGVSLGEVDIEEDDWSPLIGDTVPGTNHEIVDTLARAAEGPGSRVFVQPMTI